jgi:hypothetical protein
MEGGLNSFHHRSIGVKWRLGVFKSTIGVPSTDGCLDMGAGARSASTTRGQGMIGKVRGSLRNLRALTRPYRVSEQRWTALALLAVIIGMNLALVYVSVRTNRAPTPQAVGL